MSFWKSFIDISRQFIFFLSYFFGFISGFIFFGVFYCYLSLRKVQQNFAHSKPEKSDIDEKTIIQLIENKKQFFKTKMKQDKDNFGNLLLMSVKELILEIVKQFYPNSQYPYLELTIDESLVLILYINQRIDSVFQNKILTLFRKMTLKRIFVIRETIVNKNILQKVQKVKKITNTFNNVKNLINPFHWIKKVIFDKPLELIFIQIGISLISITGEEFYKIYSKKIFNNEDDVEKELQEVLDSMAQTQIIVKNKR
ncbi:hypothetical protein J8J04_01530 ['Fragaria x ananassa' phyllody phytoplasma]|uniref:Transmembrane protein n=1 Tax='Fragaria x ananassa' phyllody phytoplasma TaxID=2358428 RepID=A0ABS5K3M1_9MOLU|nr:hypothetical protein ['Fragaria x ananassa' phyllody phytoplasma]